MLNFNEDAITNIASSNNIEEDEDYDLSDSTSLQFNHLIKDSSFIGDYPLETIFDSIQRQFEDYINIEDETNYVDIFFNQLQNSYDRIDNIDSIYKDDMKNILDDIYRKFLDFIENLFEQRLAIVITHISDEDYYYENMEFVVRTLYTFFIIDAKINFKRFISKDSYEIIKNSKDYKDLSNIINELMDEYNPLISNSTTIDFLKKTTTDSGVYDLFMDGEFSGNFLTKYSPKFYKNDEFMLDVTNYILTLYELKSTLINSERIK